MPSVSFAGMGGYKPPHLPPTLDINNFPCMAYSARAGVMTYEYEEKLLSRVHANCYCMLTRLRDLFFVDGRYNAEVSCAQY